MAAATTAILCLFLILPPVCRGNDFLRPSKSSPNHLEFPEQITSRPGEISLLADSAYFETLTALIKKARQRIDLAMFLFKASNAADNRPALLIQELIAARRRGVQVRVLLELSGHDKNLNKANQEVAEALEKGGVTALFDSKRRTSHSKIVVVDSRYCIVGSHNLSQSALKYNHELSLLIDNPQLAKKILAYMETINR